MGSSVRPPPVVPRPTSRSSPAAARAPTNRELIWLLRATVGTGQQARGDAPGDNLVRPQARLNHSVRSAGTDRGSSYRQDETSLRANGHRAQRGDTIASTLTRWAGSLRRQFEVASMLNRQCQGSASRLLRCDKRLSLSTARSTIARECAFGTSHEGPLCVRSCAEAGAGRADLRAFRATHPACVARP